MSRQRSFSFPEPVEKNGALVHLCRLPGCNFAVDASNSKGLLAHLNKDHGSRLLSSAAAESIAPIQQCRSCRRFVSHMTMHRSKSNGRCVLGGPDAQDDPVAPAPGVAPSRLPLPARRSSIKVEPGCALPESGVRAPALASILDSNPLLPPSSVPPVSSISPSAAPTPVLITRPGINDGRVPPSPGLITRPGINGARVPQSPVAQRGDRSPAPPLSADGRRRFGRGGPAGGAERQPLSPPRSAPPPGAGRGRASPAVSSPSSGTRGASVRSSSPLSPLAPGAPRWATVVRGDAPRPPARAAPPAPSASIRAPAPAAAPPSPAAAPPSPAASPASKSFDQLFPVGLCVICQEVVLVEEQASLEPCKHGDRFHLACMLDWVSLRSVCPQCDGYVDSVNGIPVEHRQMRPANEAELSEAAVAELAAADEAAASDAAIVALLAADAGAPSLSTDDAATARHQRAAALVEAGACVDAAGVVGIVSAGSSAGGSASAATEARDGADGAGAATGSVPAVSGLDPAAESGADTAPSSGQADAPPASSDGDARAAASLPTLEQLASHPRLWRRVPAQLAPRWIALVRPLLLAYERASIGSDTEGMLLALSELLFLPQLALVRVKRSGERRAQRALGKRLSALHHEAVAREFAVSAVRGDWWQGPEHVDGRNVAAAPADEDAARVRRAVATVKAGYLGRAVSGLSSSGIADSSDVRVRDQLRALHPPASAPAPPLPTSVPILSVDADALAHLVRKRACNGAAPGASGWCGELVAPLLRDEVCRRAFCVLITDIANGVLGDAEAEYLLGSRLIAVRKGTSGIRPIAVGETFFKIAALYVVAQVTPALKDILQPIQLGVGAPGGPERAVHVIRAAVESTGPDSVVILTDARNAFNACHRSDMLAAVYSHPALQSAWRLFDWAYRAPSKLLLMRGEQVVDVLESAEGVRQGCPLAMMGYALLAQPGYEAAVADLEGVKAVAVADDLSLVGHVTPVFTAFRRYRAWGEPRGIFQQMQKCIVLWPHAHDPPQEVLDECAALELVLVRGSTEVLGAMVGCDTEKTTAWAHDIVQGHAGLFRDLQRADMPCQIAALLLRVCTLPRVGYLTRVMPPASTETALRDFDDMVQQTVAVKGGFSGQLSNEVSTQIHLPVRMAGLGLRSQASTAPIAYLSSLAQAAPDIARLKSEYPDGLMLATDAAVFDCYRRVCDTGYFDRSRKEEDQQLPAEAGSFLQHFEEGGAGSLQHAVLADVEAACFDALFQEASSESRARMLSCAGAGAGAWITAIPTSSELVMLDSAYQFAQRLRLGLPPSDALPDKCACGSRVASYPNHFLVCQLLKASGATARHDRVVRVFAAVAREAGAVVDVEPRTDGDRPDAEITWPDAIDLVDVSVTHAGASALNHGAAREPLRAAGVRERRKLARYANLASGLNVKFVPLVLETYGALAERTQDYVRKLSLARVSRPEGRDLPDQSGVIMQRLAVALQTGNARVQEDGLRRARRTALGVGRHP